LSHLGLVINRKRVIVLTYGSLFSGIGGIDLGFERAGLTCLYQVENSEYCTKVLAKHWPDVPRYGDIKQLTTMPYVDILVGGPPCQPFSHAGKGLGQSDDRYLWPEMLRLIRLNSPHYVVVENVYGLVTSKQGLVLETVYSDLERAGYEVIPPTVFPAAAIGAVHRRDRVWIVAHQARTHGYSEGLEGCTRQELPSCQLTAMGVRGKDAAYPTGIGSQGQRQHEQPLHPAEGSPWETCESLDGSWWSAEPAVGRVANGVPRRVDRLKGLGNAVVPQVAETVARILLETHVRTHELSSE
jgi:DNA (cytosine-5)-methyltransferase 1